MSTKTNFKRIALVAVSALGFGLMSVVPASATNPDLTVPVVGTAAQTVAVGSIASTTVGVTTAASLANTNGWGTGGGKTAVISIVSRPTGSAVTIADRNGDGTATDSVLDTSTASAGLGTAALGGSGEVTGTATAAVAAGPVTLGTVRIVPDVAGVYQIRIATSGQNTHAWIYAYAAAPNGASIIGLRGDGGLPSNNSVVNAVAGVANTVQVRAFPSTTSGIRSLIVVDGASSSIVTSTLNDGTTANGTLAAGTNPVSVVIPAVTDTQLAANASTTIVTIATPVVGTATARIFRETADGSGIFSATAAGTVTINVAATRSSGTISVANSTVRANLADSAADASTDATAAATVHTSTVATAFKIRVDVVARDTLNNLMPAASTDPISVSISGPGLLSSGATSSTAQSRVLTRPWGTGATVATFYVYSDGTAGTSTVTVNWGTTVLGTETLVFSGAVTTYTVGLIEPHITAASKSKAFWLRGSDANSNPVAISTVTSSSSDPTVLANNVTCESSAMSAADRVLYSAPALSYLCSVTGVGLGTATLTLFPANTTTNRPTLNFRVTRAVIASVVLKTDKASYAPGEKITLTLEAKDADGHLIGARDASSGYKVLEKDSTVNQALTGTAIDGDGALALSAGVTTTTYFAPLIPGTVTFEAELDVDSSELATALRGTKVTATATITGGAAVEAAEAATDAALEAIDAANAAVDAANQATEAADAATVAAEEARDAADAATAAVEALAADVAKMINEIKAQLKAMSKTIARIARAVR